MKFLTTLCLVFLASLGVQGKTAPAGSRRVCAGCNHSLSTSVADVFNLTDFGATGDGLTDDGPALQAALDAMDEAGGGTLFVPAGRYAIVTPVQKNFTGAASTISILGVESLTPVPPPNSIGGLTQGLDLLSEFAPRTGGQAISINITGLQSLLIKDIGFIGTPGVATDALITLALSDIREATIRHCEFYGLSSLTAGGAIVQGLRSGLNIEQTVFLGSTGNSGFYVPVVQNLEWKRITVTDAVFADYGQRPELYGKLDLAPPLSWVNIGNAAVTESDSPRREVVIRNVFFDEGALAAIASLPDLYSPPSAPIDLLFVSGVYQNASNLGTSANYLYELNQVLIENSHYGWSHNADSAINLLSVGNAILDQVECRDGANRIRADAATGRLTVINSVYTFLDSQSPATRVITTETPEDDPVQYVRETFNNALGRDPDAAAHFYWSDRLLQCGEEAQCIAHQRAALTAYLGTMPSPNFSISGEVTDESGAGLAGVFGTLGGSQAVTTQTGIDGRYRFSELPTSGVYTVTANRRNYTFNTSTRTITTPNGDQTVNFVASLNRHDITVRISDACGNALPDVTVSLSGAQERTGSTDTSGELVLDAVPEGGDYTITPAKHNYRFTPANIQLNELGSDQTVSLTGGLVSYTLSGRVVANNQGLAGATIILGGSQSGSTTADANGNYSFNVLAAGSYTVTPRETGYLFFPESMTFDDLDADQSTDFEGNWQSVVEFSAASYSVSEGARTITITVERTGNTSIETELVYSAVDGSAQQRSDVIPVIGRLRFEPGETSKDFLVFITDDSYVEGDESLTLELGNLVDGTLGNNSSATLTIIDNDSIEDAPNPIDSAQVFVRQHYRDFLNRPSDAAGLAFWSNQITSCGTDPACIADRRMNVSAAFFLSIEFQQTGFFVYRLYQASYAQLPQHLNEFLLDTRTIGEGVVVNAPGWEQLLEANKVRFMEAFVARPQFSEAYPLDLTPDEFVNRLNLKAGGPLSANDIAAAVAEFAGAATSEAAPARARVLRRVAENETFSQRELNPAFVLMQYFGYLQRNPDEEPDNNLDGYNFWLHKLDEFGGDFRRAEMVKSFLLSGEYRARFGTP